MCAAGSSADIACLNSLWSLSMSTDKPRVCCSVRHRDLVNLDVYTCRLYRDGVSGTIPLWMLESLRAVADVFTCAEVYNA